jgi:uncharacterized protein YyaL (SSP411 family)
MSADPTTLAEVGPANRLARESSRYLLLHAHNPVDWYPWGEEALDKARDEGKMIFLSIGYSSCYWCHVMERESFSDREIADFLNVHFVSIKVDREERPDLDEIYMNALQIYLQAIGSPQSGGWPMSMFLTPETKPIMGGTYFPPRDKGGFTGFLTLLQRLAKTWEEDRDRLSGGADQLAGVVKAHLGGPTAAKTDYLSAKSLDGVFEAMSDRYDPEFGGFGYHAANPRVPKFPEPSNLLFLLDRARRQRAGQRPNEHAEAMLVGTLEHLAAGGIRDHLGGGFHRYSTDRFWAIPHFEKMLYDNGQLAAIFAEAYALTGNRDFRQVTRHTLDFVLREMTGAEGGFYSAIDAETGGREGEFYAWETAELAGLLDREELELLEAVYCVREPGNFEGRHVLLLPRPIRAVARQWRTTEEDLQRLLEPIRRKLLDARNQRERPLTDTKILTAWNGLMIRGLADAGRILDDARYVGAAEKAAGFALSNLRDRDGRLKRTGAIGNPRLNAYLDDYALLVDGLIALQRATGKPEWLDAAASLTDTQLKLFWDDPLGGFFFTSADHEALIARSKDPVDSAAPSGNAVSVGNLVYLAGALDRPEYLRHAERTLRAFAPLMERMPQGMPRMAVSLAAFLDARQNY